MLAQEHMRMLQEEVEIDEEYKESQKEAIEIADNPLDTIDPRAIFSKTVAYGGRDTYFIELVTEKDDEEQFENLRTINYYSMSYVMLPDSIDLAGYNLLDRNDYAGWCEVLYALKYVPLQESFCDTLKRHNDYLEVLRHIDNSRMAFSKTFLMMFLIHWFDWLVKSGLNLWSYEDKREVYQNDEFAIKLKKEAQPIRDEWFQLLPQRIEKMLKTFANKLSPEIMLEWACEQPLQNDRLQNDYGAVHDQCLRQIWAILAEMVDIKNMKPKQQNLSFLMLLCDVAINDADVERANNVYLAIQERLLKENFSNMGNKSEVDERCQRKILELMRLLHNDLNASDIINEIAITADGWNIDYDLEYEMARREAFIVCCLLRRFEAYEKSGQEMFNDWKLVIDIFMRDYRRCDNAYIAGDWFAIPLKVAVEIAENNRDKHCINYLHEVLLRDVLNIVSLLTMLFSNSIHFSDETVNRLLDRIDEEWPSASLLMDVRGQKQNRDIIDKYIAELRKFDKRSRK